MWVRLAALLCAIVALTSAQGHSPCPGIFQYVSQKPGQWDADVTLLSDAELHGVWVRLIFDSPSTQLEVANKFGEVNTNDHVEYLVKNRDFILKASEPKKIRISVKYEGDKAPKLIGFRLNARTLCPEHGGEFGWVDGGSSQGSSDLFLGDLNNKDFLASRPVAGSFPGCGTAPLGSTSVGKNTPEGQWPWQATIYFTQGKQQKNICSATLVSPSHLITAAHCVTPKNSGSSVNPDSILIRLGEHFAKSENKGLQEVHAISITVHPGYNANNFDNDLAIIRLDKAVTITDYVRPVCLWEETQGVQSILRREGFLSGFGFDNAGRYSDRVTQAKLRVSPPDVCLNSKPELATFLSGKSFCAGYQQGNTVCVGESGSGLVFLSEESKPVWQLRGVVAVGAGLQNKLVCDESTYAVVTDVARHYKWIQSTLV